VSQSRLQVVVAGGGMVGATLALLLVRRARIDPAAVLVVEPEPATAPAADAPYDLRVSAIAPGNRRVLQELGVWPRLVRARVAAYERMVVWPEHMPPDSPDVLCFDAAEMGEPDLGSIVENRNLQAALLAQCAAQGIGLTQARLTTLATDADGATVGLGDVTVQAELVVGADGAASSVRNLLGIGENQRSYGQRGIVATVRGARGHRDTAWQRFLHTGPLALLPLASGELSIVWSAQDAAAQALLALPADEFSSALTAASAGVLGPLQLVGVRAAFPLRRLTATRFTAARCALVGDAAHVIHPLAGQGVNEGLLDAVSLADELAARPPRESVGAERALQRYARARRAGNAVMGAMVDGLDGLFTGSRPAIRHLAGTGMGIIAKSRLARQFFFTQAAGRGTARSGT
jgi:ubiquinone biosynthesis UbiH/UbiF/VisC/COQ6 family hydroxylase